MLTCLRLLAIICALGCAPLLAQLAPVASPAWAGTAPGTFQIEGNAHVPTGELASEIDRTACPVLDSLCIDRVCQALAEFYWAKGYIDAEVTCRRVRQGADTVLVTIAEGPATALGEVRFQGVAREDDPALGALFGSAVGKPISQADIERRIDEALTFYDGRGYPFAGIEPRFSRENGSMALLLVVTPGPRASIGAVQFKGLSRTKAEAVLPETGIRVGEPYDGKQVEAARGNLLRLGIFDDVSEPVLALNPQDTTVTVSFDVKEARTAIFEGVAAWAPSATGSQFTGTMRLDLVNLGGTLRQARAIWARTGGDRLSWSIFYREPRLFGRPFAAEGSISSDVVDTSFARRKFSLGLVFVGEPGFEAGTGGFLGSTKDRSLVGGEGNFSEHGLWFLLSREGRERPVNPTSGSFFEVNQEVESLRYTDSDSLDRTLSKLDARGEWVVPITASSNFDVASRYQGVFSSSRGVPVSHLVRLGGMATLRGYPEEWFTCKEALTLSLELRRLLGANSRIYAFFDGATLESSSFSFGDLSEAPYGFGLGVMAPAGTGIIRLEIAESRGGDWADLKLHFGLVQQF